jgi:DNA-binding MarR family transcriptional regulator
MSHSSLYNLEQSILPWIGKTGKWIGLYIMDKFKEHDLNLTMEQLIVLKVLHDQDGMIQNRLAHITDRNKTSLTRLVQTMEKYRLIARYPDEKDKRINRIFLTKHGSEVFKSTFPIMDEVKSDLQKGLTKVEIKTLIQILQKVQKNIKPDC